MTTATLVLVLVSAAVNSRADEERLAECGEVACGDVWRFEVGFFVFCEFVAFDGKAVGVGVAGELGVGGGGCEGDSGNAAVSVESTGDDLRSAVFAVAGASGIEVEGRETADVKAHGLVAEIVEGVDEEACPAEEKDAERDLDADGEFAESVARLWRQCRRFGGGFRRGWAA